MHLAPAMVTQAIFTVVMGLQMQMEVGAAAAPVEMLAMVRGLAAA
jgi:hypothetical protein